MCPSHHKVPAGRPKIIDFEFAREYITAKDTASDKRQGIIRKITEKAAMGQAMLLQKFWLEFNSQFSLPCGKGEKLRSEQDTEWLGCKNGTTVFEKIVFHHLPLPLLL